MPSELTMKPGPHRPRQVRRWTAAAAILVAPALGACTSGVPHCKPPPAPPAPIPVSYALVEYRAGGEIGQQPPKIEINQTSAYKANKDTFKSVAIRFPDNCLQTAASAASAVTGASRASETQTFLSTICGVYLSELERALTQNGYRVYSWDALRGLERQKNLSPYAAGKELGADIVFVFNSLDAAPVQAGSSLRASYKYFASNPRGARLQPLALDDATRGKFRDFAKSQAGAVDAKQVIALSSTLDSTAIVTSGGESVWFYRRTVTKPITTGAGMRFLFGRAGGDEWMPAVPFIPQPVGVAPPPPQVRTEDVTESQVSGSAADPYAAEELELIRASATDFVTKFHNGEK
jgi:hypothetical protein